MLNVLIFLLNNTYFTLIILHESYLDILNVNIADLREPGSLLCLTLIMLCLYLFIHPIQKSVNAKVDKNVFKYKI